MCAKAQYIETMYFDINLLSHSKNGRFSAAWLAATNKTLFRRCIKRQQCENININELCKCILDCAVKNNPLILVAKLTYGAVYIYQQQVQFLYDKVSTAACNQRALSHAPRAETFSHIDVSLNENYDDMLREPALSTEALISQLQSNENNTSVQNIDDITLIETPQFAKTALESSIENDLGFGDGQMMEYDNFLDEMPLDSAVADNRNDSGIDHDISNVCENAEGDEAISDNSFRDSSYDDNQLASTSLRIVDMPIASTSSAYIAQISNTHPKENTVDGINCSQFDTIFETELEQIKQEQCNEILMGLQLSSTNKRNAKQKSAIDKKIKLDSEAMQRGMINYNGTQRYTDPRYDIVSLYKVRYPFDQIPAIFEHPVRYMGSTLLPKLFTRNTRKRRSAQIADILKETVALEGFSILNNKRIKSSPCSKEPDQLATEIAVQNLSCEQNIVMPKPIKIFADDLATIGEFNEQNILKLLKKLWKSETQPVPFKSLEKYFSSKLEAASCFATVLVLVAKKKIIVKSNENDVCDIEAGPGLYM